MELSSTEGASTRFLGLTQRYRRRELNSGGEGRGALLRAMAERDAMLCFCGPGAGGAPWASGAGRSRGVERPALGLVEQQEPPNCSSLPRAAAGGVGGVGQASSESVSQLNQRCARASR